MVRRRIAWSHRFWGCGVFASKLVKMTVVPLATPAHDESDSINGQADRVHSRAVVAG